MTVRAPQRIGGNTIIPLTRGHKRLISVVSSGRMLLRSQLETRDTSVVVLGQASTSMFGSTTLFLTEMDGFRRLIFLVLLGMDLPHLSSTPLAM